MDAPLLENNNTAAIGAHDNVATHLNENEQRSIEDIIISFRDLIFYLQLPHHRWGQFNFNNRVKQLKATQITTYANFLKHNWNRAAPPLKTKIKPKYNRLANIYYKYIMRTLRDSDYSHIELYHRYPQASPMRLVANHLGTPISKDTHNKIHHLERVLFNRCGDFIANSPEGGPITSRPTMQEQPQDPLQIRQHDLSRLLENWDNPNLPELMTNPNISLPEAIRYTGSNNPAMLSNVVTLDNQRAQTPAIPMAISTNHTSEDTPTMVNRVNTEADHSDAITAPTNSTAILSSSSVITFARQTEELARNNQNAPEDNSDSEDDDHTNRLICCCC